MTPNLQLKIVTPARLIVETLAEEIQLPGENGYLGILSGHAPLITALAVGEISYKLSHQQHRLAVAWGFAEILTDKVTVLAETCERAEEIDLQRARAAKLRAEMRMASGDANIDQERARTALLRAENRIHVAPKL